MKFLEKFKPLSLVALAAIFFLSATLISCGDGKKEASSDEEATEEVMEEKEAKKSEHPTDDGHEHPSNDDSEKSEEEGSEHPTEEKGSEHPEN